MILRGINASVWMAVVAMAALPTTRAALANGFGERGSSPNSGFLSS